MLDENIVREVHAKNTCIRQRGITVCNVDYEGKIIYINKEALMHLSGVTFSRSIRSVTEALNLPVAWKVCRKLMYALPDFKLEDGKLINTLPSGKPNFITFRGTKINGWLITYK